MFLLNKTIKKKKINYSPKKTLARKTTQYGGDVVMFILNKIIKNKKIELSANKMLALQCLLNNPWFYCTWFRRALQMVLKPCTKPPKQPMVLLYMVYEGLVNGFKTMCKAS